MHLKIISTTGKTSFIIVISVIIDAWTSSGAAVTSVNWIQQDKQIKVKVLCFSSIYSPQTFNHAAVDAQIPPSVTLTSQALSSILPANLLKVLLRFSVFGWMRMKISDSVSPGHIWTSTWAEHSWPQSCTLPGLCWKALSPLYFFFLFLSSPNECDLLDIYHSRKWARRFPNIYYGTPPTHPRVGILAEPQVWGLSGWQINKSRQG